MEFEQPSPQDQESTSTCHLWRMPQEIVDMIIDIAYAHQCTEGIKTIRAWNEEEIRRKKHGGPSYQMRPFKPKVDDFMVSKAFFALAAKSWFSAQTWGDGPTYKSSFFRGRLFYEYGVYVDRPADSRLEAVVSCPRLHTAHIDISVDNFDELIFHEDVLASEQKLPWVDKLGESDFEKLKITPALKKASGLRTFSLRPGIAIIFAKSDEERQTWKANVKALEEYLRPVVTGSKKPSDEEYPPDRPRPLYAGSRVCCNSSELLPEDFWRERPRAGGPFQVVTRYRNLQAREEKAKETSSVFLERMLKLGLDPEEVLRQAIKAKEEQDKESKVDGAPPSMPESKRVATPSTPPPESSSMADSTCEPSPTKTPTITTENPESSEMEGENSEESSVEHSEAVEGLSAKVPEHTANESHMALSA